MGTVNQLISILEGNWTTLKHNSEKKQESENSKDVTQLFFKIFGHLTYINNIE